MKTTIRFVTLFVVFIGISFRTDAAVTADPESFDPVKEGWPLVFSDEFDGERLDEAKWFFPSWRRKTSDLARLDGKGHLVISSVPDPEKPGMLKATGIWSVPSFLCGYFEARIKFTNRPGWNTAFWLYGSSSVNPFLDGLEIDIFEDYSTRWNPPRISHNLHNNMPKEATKSWELQTQPPASFDEWQTIGCRWTPFSISIYRNGQLSRTMNAKAEPVTFSAFETSACTMPLHVLISGSGSKSYRGKVDFSKYPWPDEYAVDWVRVYALPEEKDGPQIAWACDERAAIVRTGTNLAFRVNVRPGNAPIRRVCLFDNGYPVDSKTAVPYAFDLPFSEAHYLTTGYMRPARQGRKPPFEGIVHVFVCFAEDERGRVVWTKPVLRLPESARDGMRTWDGGRVEWIRTATCLHREYEAKSGGCRSLTLKYRADAQFDHRMIVLVDGIERQTFSLPRTGKSVKSARIDLKFSSGRHELVFIPVGIIDIYGLEIR